MRLLERLGLAHRAGELDGRAAEAERLVLGPQAPDQGAGLGLIDELEGKQLVQRRQDPADRRKNVVALTPAGRGTLRKAGKASDEAERRFLAPLTGDEAAQVREALRRVAFPSGTEAGAAARQSNVRT
jgi:DNA-binding PadR family transcriptional regulator